MHLKQILIQNYFLSIQKLKSQTQTLKRTVTSLRFRKLVGVITCNKDAKSLTSRRCPASQEAKYLYLYDVILYIVARNVLY